MEDCNSTEHPIDADMDWRLNVEQHPRDLGASERYSSRLSQPEERTVNVPKSYVDDLKLDS